MFGKNKAFCVNILYIAKVLFTSKLLFEFNIEVSDIQKSVDFYQKNPRQWLEIMEKVKNEINELRKRESKKTRSEIIKNDSLKLID